MMYRLLMPLVVSILLLFGCKADDEHQLTEQPSVQKPAADLLINGRVSLGVMQNASVSIYPITAGAVERQKIATTTTDHLGNFSTAVARKYSREPVLIEVSLSDAQIICIVVSGCDVDVPFSSMLAHNGTSTVVRLVVPNLLESVDYQVSLLSEMASAAALSELAATTVESSNGISSIEARFVIAKANTRVASLFGIVADLPSARLVDITLVDEVLSADSVALLNSALESALLAECLSLSLDSRLATGLNFCTDQYVNFGIPGRTADQSFEVSMLQLWRSMETVLRHLQQSGRDFSIEISQVLAQQGVILTQEAGQYSKGTESENVNLPLLDKAKHFVQNVRQIASSLDLTKIVALTNLSSFVSGDAAIALDDFGVDVDASELVTGDKPNKSFKALGAVALKVADVIGAHFDVATGFAEDGITARHEIVGDEHQVIFDQYVEVCDSGAADCRVYVDMHFTVSLISLGGNATAKLLNIEKLTLKLNGTISHDEYTLHFKSDSASVVDFLKLQQGSGDEEGLTLVEIDNAKLILPFQVLSLGATSNHLFDGVVAFDVEHMLATYRKAQEEFISEGILHKTKKTMANLYSLVGLRSDISGRITTTADDVFYASINVLQANKAFEGLLEYTSLASEVCDDQDTCSSDTSETTFVGETDDNFVGLTASVSYKANLQGVREPVQLHLSGTRKSPTETAINSLKVTYPGHALRLNGQFNNSGGITSMNAANLDGMEMYINTGTDGKRGGAVAGPGGEQVGEIIDMGEWIKIIYPDGYFVSM